MKNLYKILSGALVISSLSATAQWSTDSKVNNVVCATTGFQVAPVISSDEAGNYIMLWRDRRDNANYALYAQKFNAAGVAQWTANGIKVCSKDLSAYSFITVCPDGKGGVLAAWIDGRGTDDNVYAQRIDASGNMLWTADGVAVCAAVKEQSEPQIAPDGKGGAIISWTDQRIKGLNKDEDIFAQRINAAGAAVWTADGIVLDASNNQQNTSKIISDNEGGAIVVFEDDGNISAQRVDSTGAFVWASKLDVCSKSNTQWHIKLERDNAGNTFIMWDDDRVAGGKGDVYVQKINNAGAEAWDADGAAVVISQTIELGFSLTPDNQGGAIIVYTGNYAQKLKADGTTAWTPVQFAAGANQAVDHKSCSDENGGIIVVWASFNPDGNRDVWAQKISTGGTAGSIFAVADNTNGVSYTHSQDKPQLVPNGNGNAVVVWQDSRNDAADVYAGQIHFSGVGIGEQELGSFSVFPNPAKSVLNFKAEKSIKNIEIRNVAGQLVINQNLNKKEGSVSLSSLTSGVYFVTLQAYSGQKTIKIIVE